MPGVQGGVRVFARDFVRRNVIGEIDKATKGRAHCAKRVGGGGGGEGEGGDRGGVN